MGACRESQNIFYFIRNKNYNRAWYLMVHFNKLTYEDSFMPIFCKIFGHKKYVPDSYYPLEVACKRCHQYIKNK